MVRTRAQLRSPSSTSSPLASVGSPSATKRPRKAQSTPRRRPRKPAGSPSTVSSAERGLPRCIDQALVRAIEEQGGFDSFAFSLDKIVKERDDIFGPRSKQVSNRTNYLRAKPQLYKDLLVEYDILRYNPPPPEPGSCRGSAGDSSEESADGRSSSGDSSSSDDDQITDPPPIQRNSPPIQLGFEPPAPAFDGPPPDTMTTASYREILGMIENADLRGLQRVIPDQLSIEPSDRGMASMHGVMVRKTLNHVVDNREAVHAYTFEVCDVNIRDIMKNRYQAYLVNGTGFVVIVLPTFSASFFEDVPRSDRYLPGDVERGIARTGMLQDEDRRRKYLLLRIPENVSNAVFSPNSTDGKIMPRCNVVTTGSVTIKFPGMAETTKTYEKYNIFWHVSVDDRRLVEANAAPEHNEAMEALGAAFADWGLISSISAGPSIAAAPHVGTSTAAGLPALPPASVPSIVEAPHVGTSSTAAGFPALPPASVPSAETLTGGISNTASFPTATVSSAPTAVMPGSWAPGSGPAWDAATTAFGSWTAAPSPDRIGSSTAGASATAVATQNPTSRSSTAAALPDRTGSSIGDSSTAAAAQNPTGATLDSQSPGEAPPLPVASSGRVPSKRKRSKKSAKANKKKKTTDDELDLRSEICLGGHQGVWSGEPTVLMEETEFTEDDQGTDDNRKPAAK